MNKVPGLQIAWPHSEQLVKTVAGRAGLSILNCRKVHRIKGRLRWWACENSLPGKTFTEEKLGQKEALGTAKGRLGKESLVGKEDKTQTQDLTAP